MGCLPDEILSHIFTFLPINSIIICTSVSKTWKSLIKNQAFISTHLHHSHNINKNNLNLLWLSRNDKQVYTLHNDDDDDTDFTEYTIFDSPFHAYLQPHHITCNVAVYFIVIRERPAFANGALHWIAFSNDNRQFVLVFDLGDEVFRQILLPELPSYTGRMVWTRVSAYGNSIAGFQRRVGSGQIIIWVMKEYGVASSWTKFSHQCPSLGILQSSGFRRNGDVVLENDRNDEGVLEDNRFDEVLLLDRRGLISWNPDSQNVQNLEINIWIS